MTEPESTSRDTLRWEILRVGVEDFVSLAAVHGIIDEDGLADSAAELQRLAVETVRSLLDEGLAEVGVLSSSTSSGFKTWPGTVDEVMTRFTDRFVAHYDDPLQWQYRVWLNLTERGEQASNEMVGEVPDN